MRRFTRKLAVPSVIAVPTLNPAPVSLGIIDHPVALAGEVAIQRMQRGP